MLLIILAIALYSACHAADQYRQGHDHDLYFEIHWRD